MHFLKTAHTFSCPPCHIASKSYSDQLLSSLDQLLSSSMCVLTVIHPKLHQKVLWMGYCMALKESLVYVISVVEAVTIGDASTVRGAYRSWKVMEFKIQTFQSWKVTENKPNGCCISDPCTCFRPLRTLSLFTVRLGSICCLVDLNGYYNYNKT